MQKNITTVKPRHSWSYTSDFLQHARIIDPGHRHRCFLTTMQASKAFVFVKLV